MHCAMLLPKHSSCAPVHFLSTFFCYCEFFTFKSLNEFMVNRLRLFRINSESIPNQYSHPEKSCPVTSPARLRCSFVNGAWCKPCRGCWTELTWIPITMPAEGANIPGMCRARANYELKNSGCAILIVSTDLALSELLIRQAFSAFSSN